MVYLITAFFSRFLPKQRDVIASLRLELQQIQYVSERFGQTGNAAAGAVGNRRFQRGTAPQMLCHDGIASISHKTRMHCRSVPLLAFTAYLLFPGFVPVVLKSISLALTVPTI